MKTIRRVKSKIKIEDVVIGLLLFGLILNIGFNINLSITKSGINIPQPFTTLFIGYGSNPAALDPVDTWDYMDRPSREMQRQVTQSLVEYDLSSQPQYQLKPVLAEYWIWESLTRISFKLRKDVYFHDGTRMTAEDLKWNFERLKWFCNDTGDLPANSTSWEGYPSSLFYLTNGTFIFNSFEANDITDPLNFTINLNAPFAPLLDLLAFGTSNILSPRSTPRWKFLDLASDILVGTGPYKYLYYIRDKEVKFERWDMYWAFPGYFEYVYFVINEDVISRMNQGLSGTYDYIHYVPRDYVVNYLNNSQFHVEEVGEDLCYFYLEFYTGPRDYSGNFIETTNNKWQYQRLNSSWRRALTLALNYTHIWEVIQYGYGYPGCPGVPRSMPGYNSSLGGKMAHDFPFGGSYEGNIKKARDIMQSMGFGYDGPGLTNPWDTNYPGMDENKWTSIIFRELIYLHHFGSTTSDQLNFLMDNNWKLIGVNVNRYHCDWLGDCYWWEVMPWEFDVQYIGWCPDYLNPYNMINPLFNLQSQSCFSRINDTTPNGLTDMLNAALTEIDRDHQLEIYENIQSYIYDVTRTLTPASHVHIPTWVYLQYQVHKTMLKGIQYNPMLILECWNWYYEE